MTPRTLLALSLVVLVPLWAYALFGNGAIYEAVVSSVSVVLTVGALYVAFGPHEGETDRADAH
ncbi:hypothetical protein ACFQFH_02100 [Halobaculum halobium]|uniref:DUF8131 domain-containing protein n=1 Tax=Halobaculum halobium TaxID=3032281 RepID=A0ABD5TBS9_9EURY|nr:hypothetical protein [Halobaculum sp. SYNS20]